jgi:hypothetical protein
MKRKDKINESFLGRGWSFPPTFSTHEATGVKMVENEIDIKQSLEILFNTSLGERVMLPEYGCELNRYLFDSISTSKIHFLRELIRSAILKYEPRITVNDILIDSKDYLDGIMSIHVAYTIQSTNTRFNIVFPYYKVEGTDIPQLYHKHVRQTIENEES